MKLFYCHDYIEMKRSFFYSIHSNLLMLRAKDLVASEDIKLI